MVYKVAFLRKVYTHGMMETTHTDRTSLAIDQTDFSPIFNPPVLEPLARNRFQRLSASSLYIVDRESAIIFIPKYPLLICTKFKVEASRWFVKSGWTRRLTRTAVFVGKTSYSV